MEKESHKHDQPAASEHGAGTGSQPPKQPKAPCKMYHHEYGEKEAKDDAEVQASLADGWTFDPKTDPTEAAKGGVQSGKLGAPSGGPTPASGGSKS